MKNTFVCIVLLATALFFAACSNKEIRLTHKIPKACSYYCLKSAQCLNKEELLQRLEPYQVIFIGDHHPQEDLHKKIAELITSLSAKNVKVHLANEWFYPSDERTLSAFTNNDINESQFLKDIQWEKRLTYYPYSSFKPMYEAVKKSKGKLHGINLSKKQRQKISDQNLSAMTKEDLAFNKSLDLNVSVHQQLVMPYLRHCHAPKKGESLEACAQRMYRVQVAWDSKMALESYKLAQPLKENEKLLVFAGSMHMENGLGIPLRFSRLSKLPALSIIPVDSQTKEVPHALGNFLIFYQENISED